MFENSPRQLQVVQTQIDPGRIGARNGADRGFFFFLAPEPLPRLALAWFSNEERLLQDACAKKLSTWAVSVSETCQMEGFSRQNLFKGLPKLRRGFLWAKVCLRPMPKLCFPMRKNCCRMRAQKNFGSGPYRRAKRVRSSVFCPNRGFCRSMSS